MKRKYKEVQEMLDVALLTAIQEGEDDNSKLLAIIKNVIRESVTETGAIDLPYLFEFISRGSMSSSKQRLRVAGHIEMVKGKAVLLQNLTKDDVEQIDQVRASRIAGELRTRILFNTTHGRPEAAEEAKKQLSLFAMEEVEVEAEVDYEDIID